VSFAGWQKVETYDSGSITVWSREDIPPAHPIPSDAMPTALEGIMWGLFPIGSSILAILLAFLLPDRERVRNPVVFPTHSHDEEHALVPEAR
jgi:hypothetical protein